MNLSDGAFGSVNSGDSSKSFELALYDRAIESLQRVAREKRSPDYVWEMAWARLMRAASLMEAGRVQQAAHEAREAYGVLQAESGRPNRGHLAAPLRWAEQRLGALLQGEIPPDGPPPVDRSPTAHWRSRIARLIADGRWEECVACCDALAAKVPDDFDLHNHRGWALLQLGRREEAVLAFERAIAAAADNRLPWHNKGWALYCLGRCEEAIGCFDRALAIDPSAPGVWLDRGRALVQLGRHVEAGECFRRNEDLLRPAT